MFPAEANLSLVPVFYDEYYKKRVSFFDGLVDGVKIKSLKHAAIEGRKEFSLQLYIYHYCNSYNQVFQNL
jgi:hypothetical protein